MSHHKRQRKHLFVDPKVQSALILRTVLYWVACLITMTLMLLCWQMITGPTRLLQSHFDDMWVSYRPALLASFLLLPMVIVDIIRLSNRFVGPLLRLRRSMRALARGEDVASLEFREGDFWQDLANEFNAVRLRMKSLADAAQTEDRELEEAAAGS